MTFATKSSLVISLLAVASCAGGGPDLVVHNTAVVVRTDARFARSADFPQRFESTVQTALAYWGGTWDDLDGSTVTLEGEQHVSCKGANDAIGCHDGNDIRISTRDPSIGEWNCLEATVLVHEIGHAVIGDPDHTDPRWMDFGVVASALSGRPGHDGVCTIYPSVWRHVLARR